VIEIVDAFSGSHIWSCDSESMVEAIFSALKAKISLHGANLADVNLNSINLRGAKLAGVFLRNSTLNGAILEDADLSRSCLGGTELRGASLRGASLRNADLEGSDLRDADLRDADLCGADLTNTDLRGSNLKDAKLEVIRRDLCRVLDGATEEAPEILSAIYAGRINGHQYHGECSCLLGTIAKLRGVENIDDLSGVKMDSDSPIERWFLAISPGCTPENHPVSAVTAQWVSDWLSSR